MCERSCFCPKILLAMATCLLVAAGCAPSSRAAAQTPLVSPSGETDMNKYEWSYYTADQALLSKNGVVIGQWYYPDSSYYPWNGTDNQSQTKPPIDPPGRGTPTQAGIENWQKFGIPQTAPREQVSIGGKVVKPNQLKAAFEGKLEDDSAKGYFVIIAKDKGVRDKVLADWQTLPSDFTSRYNVWSEPPDQFSMQDRFSGKPRFCIEGDPTVQLMQKDGTVLFRRPQCEQSYKSSDMADLLKSDPDYNPKLDPGAVESTIELFDISLKTFLAALASLVGGVLIYFRRIR